MKLYEVVFYRPFNKKNKQSERFTDKNRARAWRSLVILNGYEAEKVREIKNENSNKRSASPRTVAPKAVH